MILQLMRTICTVEGSIGFLLNALLLFHLFRSSARSARIFRVPMYISGCIGLYLSFAIAVMNFTHIFRDGTFVIVLINPLVEYLPDTLRDVMFQIACVFTSLMWSFTPATCILQLSVLAKRTAHWEATQRLFASFSFTIVCLIFVAYTVPLLMPSCALTVIMEISMRELFEIPDSQFVQTYGISITYEEINDGKSMLDFTLIFVAIPYCFSYTIIVIAMQQIRKRLLSNGMAFSQRTIKMQRHFFIMQLLQSVLPLAILSIPVGIVTYGTIANADLCLSTLPLTSFVWLCPVVQSAVQLRYVRQSSTSTPASSQAFGTSKVSTTREHVAVVSVVAR